MDKVIKVPERIYTNLKELQTIILLKGLKSTDLSREFIKTLPENSLSNDLSMRNLIKLCNMALKFIITHPIK